MSAAMPSPRPAMAGGRSTDATTSSTRDRPLGERDSPTTHALPSGPGDLEWLDGEAERRAPAEGRLVGWGGTFSWLVVLPFRKLVVRWKVPPKPFIFLVV